jgi:hypothetical protein
MFWTTPWAGQSVSHDVLAPYSYIARLKQLSPSDYIRGFRCSVTLSLSSDQRAIFHHSTRLHSIVGIDFLVSKRYGRTAKP